MDPAWIAVAFALGFVMRQVGLPPLVGFLAAGFVLRAFGVESTDTLDVIADTGVLLLLFSLGLKLKLSSLGRPEVWGTATVHMAATVAVFGLAIWGLGVAGFSVFAGIDLPLALLLGFALSFSSTVFAVKILEEKGEAGSLHGRTAIGILIMQDIFAVVFMTVAVDSWPSAWAPALLGLILVRPLLMRLLDRGGHGELLVLMGLLLPLAGAGLFKGLGLKADLGALILGMMLAGHPKADELSKALLSFKDAFLVAFFLTIGLGNTPDLAAVGTALLLVLVLPFKVALFFAMLTRFKLRARTSLLTSFSLANYSEFGLIVGAVGVSQGYMDSRWLMIIAIALSITFVAASPLNTSASTIYVRLHGWLARWQRTERIPGDGLIDPGASEYVVIGVGRVGTGAYDRLRAKFGEVVMGIDDDPETVHAHSEAGRCVALGDASDTDFWERIWKRAPGKTVVRLILLCLPDHQASLWVARYLNEVAYPGKIAAVARFEDHRRELEEAGVSCAFNMYAEAGKGFTEHVCRELEDALGPSGAVPKA